MYAPMLPCSFLGEGRTCNSVLQDLKPAEKKRAVSSVGSFSVLIVIESGVRRNDPRATVAAPRRAEARTAASLPCRAVGGRRRPSRRRG